ncbi:MAG: symmetrical bis(5'-nucleosyl)-tetraphosphatase [Cellvibrio sp.]
MATYAIGDIQGCYDSLQCLLEKIAFNPEVDKLWLVGDLINRGPDSLATLRYLYSIRHSVEFVLGNHDLHFLAVSFGLRKMGQQDTLRELLGAPDRQQLIDWLIQGKLLHTDEALGYTMVHAGIPPMWSLHQAQAHAREVEAVLQSRYCHEFLSSMYGNQPNRWKNKLIGMDRLRVITNYFTRMRFCTDEGMLELDTKESASGAPLGFAPWFSFPERKTNNDKIIFGHWAALEGNANTPNVYALDTGCVWGGSLSAMRLEDKQLFNCDCIA